MKKRRGMLVIISAPSGTGKSTIAKSVLESFPDEFYSSVSVTTRKPRIGEFDGVHYHFVSSKEYHRMLQNGELLEHAEVFDNCYGTPRKPVEDAIKDGKDVLLDIDWQGSKQIYEKMAEDIVSIFILPPSYKDLEKRLRLRDQDPEEVINFRMQKAKAEIDNIGKYSYVIVNDDLQRAISEVKAIIIAERLKQNRQVNLDKMIESL